MGGGRPPPTGAGEAAATAQASISSGGRRRHRASSHQLERPPRATLWSRHQIGETAAATMRAIICSGGCRRRGHRHEVGHRQAHRSCRDQRCVSTHWCGRPLSPCTPHRRAVSTERIATRKALVTHQLGAHSPMAIQQKSCCWGNT
jgi:hypothetical protein